MDEIQAKELSQEIKSYTGAHYVSVILEQKQYVVHTVDINGLGVKTFRSFNEWIRLVEEWEHSKRVM